MPDALGLNEIAPPSSVLLLGSGFSVEGKNLYGKAPPNWAGLREHFLQCLALPLDTRYDLQVLAEEFAHESSTGLYRELYNLFHITEFGTTQEAILREQWLRIYTTNYDDTVEFCRHTLRLEETSYTSSGIYQVAVP